MRKKLEASIAKLPLTTGVYKFLDSSGSILYIGKAVNLKSRVSSYFNPQLNDRPWVAKMIHLIDDVEYTITDNEIEALILESALVKQFQPKYNSDLKDDKSYAWLYINTQADYPTVKIVRNINKDDYKKGHLFGPYPSGNSIRRVFSYIRKIYPFCTSKDPTSVCFHSRIGLCPGPNATKDEYRKNIDGILKFLKGRNRKHITSLELKMKEYSTSQQYELAAQIRDQISDLKYLGSEIKFTYFNTEQEYINSREEKSRTQIDKLAKQLNLKSLSRIECYDISNIQGNFAVGSMVVSKNGIPTNSEYRTFKIRNVDGINDAKMLKQVLERRLKYFETNKDASLTQKPDLILIDGGKGQLSVIKDTIADDILVLGITKGRKYRRKGKRLKDEFWRYTVNGIENVLLKETTLFSILRDEAHRFAITAHRKLRAKYGKKSVLDQIPGIGLVLKRKLLKSYTTIENISKAPKEELYKILKNKKTVENLLKAIR